MASRSTTDTEPRAWRRAAMLMGIYAATRIYMVFKSGLPQPADMALTLTFLLYLRPSHLRRVQRAFPEYVGFVAWVATVSAVWSMIRSDAQYMRFVAFQVFNLLLFTLVLTTRLNARRTFDTWVARGIAVSSVLQTLAIAAGGRTFRARGSFNNENQLGYWAVCALGVYTLVRPKPTMRDLPIVALLLWAELVSTSRAGFVACVIVLMIWGWQLFFKSKQRYFFIGAGVLGTMLLIALPSMSAVFGNVEVFDNLEQRFNKESSSEEMGFRNLDRISNYPEYTVLGAGEGDLDRFPYSLSIIEIHSTPATVLFSYGIPGTLLFIAFFVRVTRRLPWRKQVIMGALVLYSLTHNGMRFSYGWFLIATLAAEPYLMALRSRQSAMASRMAPLTNRTSKRLAMSPRLPSA